MNEEKDKAIEKLQEEKKAIRVQMDTERNERAEKMEKGERNEKIRREKQLDKVKKQLQSVKKNAQKAEKEREQLTDMIKDFKKKNDEQSKRLAQFKASSNQLE